MLQLAAGSWHTTQQRTVALSVTLARNARHPATPSLQDDDELWQTDPHEYVRKAFDIVEDFYSARTAAVNLLCDLVKKRGKDTLHPFLSHLVQMLTERASRTAQSYSPRAVRRGAASVRTGHESPMCRWWARDCTVLA
jgi:hypothetical protein